MMLVSVPILSSEWSGTGTVIVVSPERFCMTTWLPRWRTVANPSLLRISQTSRPDSTRSLPNRDLDPSYEHFAVQPARDLGRVGRLKEEFQGLDEIGSRGLDRIALAGDIQFGAQRDVSVIFALDDGGQLVLGLHEVMIAAANRGLRLGSHRVRPAMNRRAVTSSAPTRRFLGSTNGLSAGSRCVKRRAAAAMVFM